MVLLTSLLLAILALISLGITGLSISASVGDHYETISPLVFGGIGLFITNILTVPVWFSLMYYLKKNEQS